MWGARLTVVPSGTRANLPPRRLAGWGDAGGGTRVQVALRGGPGGPGGTKPRVAPGGGWEGGYSEGAEEEKKANMEQVEAPIVTEQ